VPSEAHEKVVRSLIDHPVAFMELTPEDLRSEFESIRERLFPIPDDVVIEETELDGVGGEWVHVPESRDDRVIVYLHGGGYLYGSARSHRQVVAGLARAACARVFAVDYRRAPEHRFPAALDDALTAIRAVVARGVAAERLIVAGDSAGGGLTLAAMTRLRDGGERLPAAGICLSPWTDLELAGDSARPGAVDDPMCTVEDLRKMAALYAEGRLRDPLASPVHADLQGLPPLLILVGTREILLDDATRVAENARAAGVSVQLECWDGLIHVWPIFGQVPEAAAAIARMGEFAREHF
jgi:acetyl esterase/lipase